MDASVGILFFVAELALVISVLSLITQPKLSIYRVFASYSFLLTLWAYCTYAYSSAISLETAESFFMISSVGLIQPSLILHVTLIFIGQTNFFKDTNNFLMVYAPTVFMIFAFIYTRGFNAELVRTDIGWTIMSGGSIFWPLFSLIWAALFNLISCWLLYRFWRKVTAEPKKTQTKIILVGRVFTVTVFTILLLGREFDAFSRVILIEYFLVGMAVELILIGLALIRYRLISFDYKDIVDDVVESSNTVVALMSVEGEIVRINPAIERLLGLHIQQLVGKSFNKLLYFGNASEGWNSIVKKIGLSSTPTTLELEFRGSSGDKIPVNAWMRPIYELGSLKGYSMMADDARELFRYRQEVVDKDILLEREKEIRKIASDLYLKIRDAGSFNISYVLEDVISTVRTALGLADAYIVIGEKIIADPGVSFSRFISNSMINGKQLEKELEQLGIKYKKFTLSKDPTLENSFFIAVPGGPDKKLPLEDEQHLRTLCNSIGAAMENTILGMKNEALGNIAERVVYIDSDHFYKIISQLEGKEFQATYLIADVAESVNLKIEQDQLQRVLKEIIKSHGAVWGNSWGDMIHGVFSDHFKEEVIPSEMKAYQAGIEICKTVRERFGAVMKVGIASGPISVSSDTTQMNQNLEDRIIDKSALAQEGRPGVNTLQAPREQLKKFLEDQGWHFVQTKDLVRGEIKDVWKLQKITEEKPLDTNRVVVRVPSPKSISETLGYDPSVKILLTKGIDGHEHFEGGQINHEISSIIRKAGEYFDKNPQHNERFLKLTGKSSGEVLEMLDEVESWGETRQEFDFAKHFLPWLFIMKLGESSNPELIYELTKAQLANDLHKNSGVTKEVYPLVWSEMGMNYDACVEAFVFAVEDVLKSTLITGPIKIGIGIKRQHLELQIKNTPFREVSAIEYPYLKCLKVLEKLKDSTVPKYAQLFVDTIDMERLHPLFSYKDSPERGEHTKNLYREVNNLGVRSFVHTLEDPFIPDLAPDLPRDYEFNFMVDLFEELDIKNPRFIHMAYWSANLPHLDRLKAMGAEIATCPSSTHILGASHTPQSPFLFKKQNVIDGVLYDKGFPRIIASSDDSGPFSVRNVWEEIEVIYNDLSEWFDRETASLFLVQLLRNGYEELTPFEISRKYKLDQKAVEWATCYDIYTEKSQLKSKEIRNRIVERVEEIMKVRRNILKK